eukprot:3642437-Pleurochrysis_carterae.AAC.1
MAATHSPPPHFSHPFLPSLHSTQPERLRSPPPILSCAPVFLRHRFDYDETTAFEESEEAVLERVIRASMTDR